MKLSRERVFLKHLGRRCDELPVDLRNAAHVFLTHLKMPKDKETMMRLCAALLDKYYTGFWSEMFTFSDSAPAWWEEKFPDMYLLFPRELDDTGLLDHWFWLTHKETGETVLLLQPYGEFYQLDMRCFQRLTAFCEKHGLVFSVSAMSPHFPSRTLNVFISRKKEVRP